MLPFLPLIAFPGYCLPFARPLLLVVMHFLLPTCMRKCVPCVHAQANHPFFICVPVLRQLVLSVCAHGFVHFSVYGLVCMCVPCCMLVCLYLSSQYILLHYAPGCLFL